uniref:Uncharacterized protein n=1 Tax=viral metagenome TaxID=1070528 RepID=A0A6H1ZJD5_9ZZZZ
MSIDRKEETKVVKAALKNAGIPAKVGHHRGTAWGWIAINVGDPAGRNGVNPETRQYTQEEQAYQDKALKIAQQVTGRTGEYDGRISLSAQGVV